ncbi:cationic amino acid transporter 4 isoform X2 [Oratosquilla oratoria]
MTPRLRHRLVVEWAGRAWHHMGRTKTVSQDLLETPLNRCLSTLDITLLGIGHMVGAGIYVLTGAVAKDTAGPAIVLSFLLAGLASLLAALCYAEFGARVPKAGSAYVYTYVTIGEFWAFVIGWNIILEHMIGAASVARAWSGAVDSMLGGALRNATITALGEMHDPVLAHYPDFLAFVVTLVYCGLLSLGVKGSTYFNSVFTLINLCVMTFVIILGLCYADVENWKHPGGFAPYGFSGVLAGAAACFYAFVGFDSIATSGEEAREPAKSIPVATLVSMAVVTLSYILVAATLTLMVPYTKLNPSAALPDAFAQLGVTWAQYVVSIGALCGMTTTLFGSLFSLPRCVYAMATDGLLFSWLAKVNNKTQVPILNLAICGFCSAVIALLFDIEKLVEFMSIGTLMAYTIVSASVVILRYRPASRSGLVGGASPTGSITPALKTPTSPGDEDSKFFREGGTLRPSFHWIVWIVGQREAGSMVAFAVVVFTVVSASLSSLLQWGNGFLGPSPQAWAVCLVVFLLLILATCVMVIVGHEQNGINLSFKVPLVPFVPLASIFFNMALMTHLNVLTWVRFVIWMILGLLVYFLYGMSHSKESQPVSTYSTLISQPAPANSTVFGAMQQTFTNVTARISGTKRDDTTPIVRQEEGRGEEEEEEVEEVDEEEEEEEEDRGRPEYGDAQGTVRRVPENYK